MVVEPGGGRGAGLLRRYVWIMVHPPVLAGTLEVLLPELLLRFRLQLQLLLLCDLGIYLLVLRARYIPDLAYLRYLTYIHVRWSSELPTRW